MALEGHGIAFLPLSAVKKELRAKKLVSAVASQDKPLDMAMHIRVYRERPASHTAAKSSAQTLWIYLDQQARAKITAK